MTVLTLNEVQTIQKAIMQMDASKLRQKAQSISMSDIDDKARKYINQAIDLRYAQLCEINTSGCMVEMSEADYELGE